MTCSRWYQENLERTNWA